MSHVLLKLVGILLMLTALAVAVSRAPDRHVQGLVARWAPPPSDFVELNGQLVHLRDEGPRGDPAPLVLLHGTSASLHTWEGWVKALKPTHRVISLDLPGFGLTGPNASADYHGDTYARFVLALLDQLKVQRFALAGNSLGGEIAWRVASLAPQRVDRLVLVDAAGYPFTPESMPLGFRIARMPGLRRLPEHLLPRGLVEQSVRNVYGDPAKVGSALVDRYFELTLREGNRRALTQRFEAQAEDIALAEQNIARIRALKLPTLILWGERDRLIPPAIGQRFQADIAGSQLQVFSGLGHVPHEEDPAATVKPVLAFLAAPRQP
jgi:pimeloyl-ACP methyl ester carboxylesterase